MKNPNTEKNIPLIRTRLHRKGVTGVPSQEIRDLLENNDNNIDDAVETLLKKYQSAIAVDSGENDDSEPEEDFKALLKINSNDNSDNTVSMIKSEAQSMGLVIPVNHINNIATSVKQSRTFQSDKLKAIKSALIAYIDWQHEESTNEATQVIEEVKQHATNKAVDFNNNMVGELSDFFRTSEQNTEEFTKQLISALSVD
ncbi:hypothetical protein [Dolichospermum phage Dfl-JY23]